MTDGDNYEAPHSVLIRSGSRAESTTSDSDSSVAPTDFQLSESFERSAQGAVVSVALERCWLCLGSRRSFYCRQCIRTGDFVHSRPLQQPFQPLRPPADLERWVTVTQLGLCLLQIYMVKYCGFTVYSHGNSRMCYHSLPRKWQWLDVSRYCLILRWYFQCVVLVLVLMVIVLVSVFTITVSVLVLVLPLLS